MHIYYQKNVMYGIPCQQLVLAKKKRLLSKVDPMSRTIYKKALII